MTTQDIVQKLWNLCDVLRDDGINYSDYVTELVLLLFIKMEFENAESGLLQKHRLPAYARWPELRDKSGLNLLRHYRETPATPRPALQPAANALPAPPTPPTSWGGGRASANPGDHWQHDGRWSWRHGEQ